MTKKTIWTGILVIAPTLFLPIIWWYVTASRSMEESRFPGTYTSDGSWGKSILIVRPDHSFHQEAYFTNVITGADVGYKTIDGTWQCTRHSISENQIRFEPFIRLDPVDGKRIDKQFDTFYTMMLSAASLAVSPGAGIYYFRAR